MTEQPCDSQRPRLQSSPLNSPIVLTDQLYYRINFFLFYVNVPQSLLYPIPHLVVLISYHCGVWTNLFVGALDVF
jgi:hypothetical protein